MNEKSLLPDANTKMTDMLELHEEDFRTIIRKMQQGAIRNMLGKMVTIGYAKKKSLGKET